MILQVHPILERNIPNAIKRSHMSNQVILEMIYTPWNPHNSLKSMITTLSFGEGFAGVSCKFPGVQMNSKYKNLLYRMGPYYVVINGRYEPPIAPINDPYKWVTGVTNPYKWRFNPTYNWFSEAHLVSKIPFIWGWLAFSQLRFVDGIPGMSGWYLVNLKDPP